MNRRDGTTEAAPSPQRAWIEAVEARPHSMRQRRLSVVEAWPGGVAALVAEATARGVHLLQLTDDRGVTLIAASRTPFKVLV